MKKIHSNTLLLSIAAFLMLVPAFCRAQESAYPFRSGEKVRYIIHYKWGTKTDIGAVDVALTRKEDPGCKPYFYVRADIATYKFWDGIYKVRDLYESKFYADGLMPFYFHRDVSEGDFWAKNHYYWSNGGKTLRAVVDKRNRPHRDTSFTCNTVIRDMFNLFFTCRGADVKRLVSGKVACYTVAMDKDLLDIRIKYVGKEVKKVSGLGSFKALKFAVSVDAINVEQTSDTDRSRFSIDVDSNTSKKEDNVFYGDGKIFFWLTDDDNHLPIFFTAPVAVGSINGRIGSMSGLKYPLKSKLD